MICPKCSDIMRTYERNGVHVEQCAACKGIFLDRGELEQLAAAERHYYAAEAGDAPASPLPPSPRPPPAVPPSPYQPPPESTPPPRDLYGAPRERAPYDWLDERDHRSSDPYRGEGHREDRYRYDERHRYDERRHKKRKKKDFLDVLFDL